MFQNIRSVLRCAASMAMAVSMSTYVAMSMYMSMYAFPGGGPRFYPLEIVYFPGAGQNKNHACVYHHSYIYIYI